MPTTDMRNAVDQRRAAVKSIKGAIAKLREVEQHECTADLCIGQREHLEATVEMLQRSIDNGWD